MEMIYFKKYVLKHKTRGDEYMSDDGPTASIILFVLLLLIDIFFYGFGAAVRTLNEKEIGRRAMENKDPKSVRLYQIIKDPTRYVNTVQLVVTMINVIVGGWYLGSLRITIQAALMRVSENFFGKVSTAALTGLGIATVVLTLAFLLYILLTFGVLLPKKIAVRHSEAWAYACINPAYFVAMIFLPMTGLVTVSANGVLRLFGMKPDAEILDVTEEEIISMVNEGHEQGVIEAREAEMITNIFEYGDKEAQDIMTHRSNIVGIDGNMRLWEAIGFMLSEKNSRYPVYEENIDHIIGILHLKDALRIQTQGADVNCPVKEIKELLREARFIPQTRNIDTLFKAMQSQKLQMVIVVDEYGQTAGLIAMEDILEEIVGNIMDEYDEEEDHIEEKSEDEYVIEGITPLEELEDKLGIRFAEEEFETLNGFLISKMDKIPSEDEEFDVDVDGYNFKILSVENKMIHRVLVTRLPRQETEDKPVQKTEEQESAKVEEKQEP